MNYYEIWEKVLKEIKNNVNSLIYASWFEPTKLYKIENDTAIVIVPLEIHKKHLSEHYYKLVSECLHNATKKYYNISFVLEEDKI